MTWLRNILGLWDKAEFIADSLTYGTDEGKVCKLTANKQFGLCSDGNRFQGVIQSISTDNITCIVYTIGYVNVPYSGTAPTFGLVKLSADATGGVKIDAINGIEYLVIDVDTVNAAITFLLIIK